MKQVFGKRKPSTQELADSCQRGTQEQRYQQQKPCTQHHDETREAVLDTFPNTPLPVGNVPDGVQRILQLPKTPEAPNSNVATPKMPTIVPTAGLWAERSIVWISSAPRSPTNPRICVTI